eukprot:563377-Pelagomonas_calceolata.AAC.2
MHYANTKTAHNTSRKCSRSPPAHIYFGMLKLASDSGAGSAYGLKRATLHFCVTLRLCVKRKLKGAESMSWRLLQTQQETQQLEG